MNRALHAGQRAGGPRKGVGEARFRCAREWAGGAVVVRIPPGDDLESLVLVRFGGRAALHGGNRAEPPGNRMSDQRRRYGTERRAPVNSLLSAEGAAVAHGEGGSAGSVVARCAVVDRSVTLKEVNRIEGPWRGHKPRKDRPTVACKWRPMVRTRGWRNASGMSRSGQAPKVRSWQRRRREERQEGRSEHRGGTRPW